MTAFGGRSLEGAVRRSTVDWRGCCAAAFVLAALVFLGASSDRASAGAWPGLNGKIVFKTADDLLMSMNPDGSNKTQLTDGQPPDCFQGDEEPSVSADGTKIVFTRTTLDGQEVWSMNADGSGQTRLTTAAIGPCENSGAAGMFSENPSWSPDGSQILFTSDRSGVDDDEDLWLMNADGSNQQKFYGDNTHHESEAFFSPDGTKILFQLEPTANDRADLWTMDADGTNPQPLTSDDTASLDNENATWSPDGTRVAFTKVDSTATPGQTCEGEVWVIDVATKVETQLTDCDGATPANPTQDSEHPAWSPDGTKIVYHNSSHSDSIWIMDADGSNPAEVPRGPFIDNGQPDWGPAVALPPPDTTAPQTTITKAKISQSKRKATFKFSSSEPASTFECKLDKKPFKSCTSPKSYKKLKPGKHKFKVRATDTAGNTDPTPAVKKFKIKR